MNFCGILLRILRWCLQIFVVLFMNFVVKKMAQSSKKPAQSNEFFVVLFKEFLWWCLRIFVVLFMEFCGPIYKCIGDQLRDFVVVYEFLWLKI